MTTGRNPWFQNDEEYERHLEKIKDTDLWPKSVHITLNLKHPERMKEKGSQDTAFGSITPGSYEIFVGHGANRSLEHYSSAEEILAAGWVVD